MTPTHRKSRKFWPLVALFTTASLLTFQNLEATESTDGFRMKFAVEQAHGDLLQEGKYLRAIGLLDNSRNADSFTVKTNLCVARAMSGQLRQAQYACRRSIELAEEQVRNAPVDARSKAYAALGDAYNNRGVLNILLGNEEAALEDLTAAISLPVMCNCAGRNLARLRSTLDRAVAAR